MDLKTGRILSTDADAGAAEAEPAAEVGAVPEDVYLVGVSATRGDQGSTVWLFDRRSNKRTLLKQGDRFRIGPAAMKVERIEDRAASVEGAGIRWTWELGKSFADHDRR